MGVYVHRLKYAGVVPFPPLLVAYAPIKVPGGELSVNEGILMSTKARDVSLTSERTAPA